MNKTTRIMLLIVLIFGVAATVYWLEQPAPTPAPAPLAQAPDLNRLAEQALAVYRSTQNMQTGSKPGQWKLDAKASNSAGPFVGAFGPLQLARDGQGRQLLLTSVVFFLL